MEPEGLLPHSQELSTYPYSADQRGKMKYVFTTTNSIELSTTREATSCASTREPPSILWNPSQLFMEPEGSLLHSQELSLS
jgi:hypothetical protein